MLEKGRRVSTVIEVETYNKLKGLAVEDFRSVSSMVRYIIKEYIRGIEKGSIVLTKD